MVNFWLGKPKDGKEVVIEPKGFLGQLFHYGIVSPIKFTFSLITFPFRWAYDKAFGVPNSESLPAKLTHDRVKNYLSDSKRISGPEAHKLIAEAINKRADKDELAAAMMVDSANMLPITMYGRHISKGGKYEDLPDIARNRRAYDVHPYRKAGVGADVAVFYRNKNDGELYTLMGRKELKRGHPEAGYANEWTLVSGYMQPYPLEGGRDGKDNVDEELRDILEEAVGRGEKSVDFAALKKTSHDGKVKYDASLKHCASRELAEETGISNVPHFKSIGTRSKFGITNDPKLHTVVLDYVADFGERDAPPVVQEKSDLKHLTWIRVSDISVDPSVGQQKHGSIRSRYKIKDSNGRSMNIRDDHGDVLEKAVASVRDREFLVLDKEDPVNVEQAHLRLSKTLKSSGTELLPLPKSHLGAEAHAYYDQLGTSYKDMQAKMAEFAQVSNSVLQNAFAQAQPVVDNSRAVD